MALDQAAPSCWVCLMGCVFPEDMCHRAVDDRTRFYCSKECMWLDESNPGRYVGDRNFFDRYHGWELSELVRDLGFVRADGKTLIAQPHLEDDNMWTLDDVKSMDFHVQSPNITVAEKMGLPNGSSVGLVTPNGHIDGGLKAAAPWRNGNGRRQRRRRRSPLSMSPRVVFEPIGEEIDCDEEESVLDAAFRHGYNLVYGCREGQCSACKAYLLEGEVVLKPYSTFALSESEESNGYTLLCRAMPEEDLVVELLHFDPDNYKLEHEIRDGRGDGHRGRGAHPRHPAARAARSPSRPTSRSCPGQYVDVWIPGVRRAALVLDGEPARRRAHRADRQALPGRPLLEPARRRDRRRRRAAVHRPLRRVPPARQRPADADGGGRLRHGADPVAAAQRSQPREAIGRCASSTARAPSRTSSTSTCRRSSAARPAGLRVRAR